jgi:heme-degrading monooxygenase HmoA
MVAVIFEVIPETEGRAEYLAIAAQLRDHLSSMPGFISIERFQSLTDPAKLLSLSFWEDAASVARWRNLAEHRAAQARGRSSLFSDYRIRVGRITRDYSMTVRSQVPQDSRDVHD